MRQRLTVLALVTALAAMVSAEGQTTSGLNITLRITQSATIRHPHAPAGDAGDVFSTTLTLYAITPAFDRAAGTNVGSMSFSYVLHGSCSDSAGNGCKGSTDITTVSRLPGGTIMANGVKVPIRTPFIVKVFGGTGRYAGARGTIVIAPDGLPKNIYKLTLP